MNTIVDRNISVIGLGYVGLPVAVAFSQFGRVVAFDINKKRIDELNNSIDKTGEVESGELNTPNIFFTSDPAELSNANFHIVAVPTPINELKEPNLEPLLSASKIVGNILKKGDIVVYESTVYPGATENECANILEKESKLICGKDFFIGYSPERINPGDKNHTLKTIKKIVSAQDENTLDTVADIYSLVIDAGVYKASSIKVAEAAKVIENTQRDLNIALMNELAILFKTMDIDTHDVLEAAGTKWNFLPFEPGLVGGHCIGVDPYYLTFKSEQLGYTPQVILSGRVINDSMGKYIADKIIHELKRKDKKIQEVIVTILGFTFKENIPDIRNTRVIDIINEFNQHSISTQIYDPRANANDVRTEYQIELVDFQNIKKSDVVILAVPHKELISRGWEFILNIMVASGGIVFDVKGVLNRSKKPNNIKLYRL
ncbi:MAG: GDP-mannose dehydrogenase [Legionellales bacterium]|nr:GDP-mannose dehydrogenase [Legionellales bacterium]